MSIAIQLTICAFLLLAAALTIWLCRIDASCREENFDRCGVKNLDTREPLKTGLVPSAALSTVKRTASRSSVRPSVNSFQHNTDEAKAGIQSGWEASGDCADSNLSTPEPLATSGNSTGISLPVQMRVPGSGDLQTL